MATVICLTACTPSHTISLNVVTGDNITATLNTTNGYEMSYENDTFHISDGISDVLIGTFITTDSYTNNYLKYAELYGVLKSGSIKGINYIMYTEDSVTYNIVGQIENSNTSVFFNSIRCTQEQAKDIFEMLSFDIIKND